MYKLICTDVDGTLIDTEGNLLECDRLALKSAYEKGLQIAIVSGRYHPGIEKIAKKLEIPVWYTCFNGLYVEADNNKVLYEGKSNKKSLEIALDTALENDCYPVLFSADKWFVQGKGYFYDFQCKMLSEQFGNVCNLKTVLNSDTNIYKVIIKNREHSVLEKVRKQIIEKHVPDVELIYSSQYILEVLPKGTDKSKAIECYSKYMNIDKSQIIALGDYDNDINMLKAAGTSVAMGNATQECKDCATFVTKNVTEGGLSYAINRLIN